MICKTLTEFKSSGGPVADEVVPESNGQEKDDTKIASRDYAYYRWRTLQCLRLKLDDTSAKAADFASVMAIVFLIKNEVRMNDRL